VHWDEPAFCWDLPKAHEVHEVTSWPVEYWPAMQGLHVTPLALNSPALQSVAEQELAPTTTEFQPAAQAVHAVALPVEYLPAVQLVQDDAWMPEYWPEGQ
jgi:hypothetical protein